MRTAPDLIRTAITDPDRQGPRRAPAPAGVEEGTGPGPVAVRRGPGGRGLNGRSDRGRPGRFRAQCGPLAPPSRGSRASRGTGALGQGAAVPPAGPRGRSVAPAVGPVPAGQARGTWRALARARVASRIRYETVRRVLKNELTPWRRVQRGYPPVPEADFVIPMEAVLDLYSQPYAACYPVISRDEQPQPRRADKRPPHPASPGHPATYDYACVRHDTCTLWLCVEPLGPWRTDVDWARQVKALAVSPGRAPDPGLRQPEHPRVRLFFSGPFRPPRRAA